MEPRDQKRPLIDQPLCLWMQAGVVKRKSCKIDYNCPECRFDIAMRQMADENSRLKNKGEIPKGTRGEIIYWKDKLRSLPIQKRPCVHHMKGRIEFRACTHDYRCGNCDFDQFFYDQYSVHAVVSPVEFADIKGFKVPHGYYFHHGHAWAKIEEESSVRIGLDDFALRLLGPLERIDAPLIGKKVKQGRGSIRLSREENSAEILSPISGIVTSTNANLAEKGYIANQDPYSDGWIMRVKTDNLRQDLKGLMIKEETEEFLNDQVDQLYKEIEEVSGPISADGGYLGKDICGNMPNLGWNRLVKKFLQT